MPKCDFTLRYGCSPVNLPHIFRTPFLMNSSGRLLLSFVLQRKKQMSGFYMKCNTGLKWEINEMNGRSVKIGLIPLLTLS